MSIKHCHPAAERNKEAILHVLRKYIDINSGRFLLEISSGSGQHVAHIAPHFPRTRFQPTEIEKSSLQSINGYIAESTCFNISDAQFLDVREPPNMWLGGILRPQSVDYILNINMIHISEWACAVGKVQFLHTFTFVLKLVLFEL